MCWEKEVDEENLAVVRHIEVEGCEIDSGGSQCRIIQHSIELSRETAKSGWGILPYAIIAGGLPGCGVIFQVLVDPLHGLQNTFGLRDRNAALGQPGLGGFVGGVTFFKPLIRSINGILQLDSIK